MFYVHESGDFFRCIAPLVENWFETGVAEQLYARMLGWE